MCWLSILQAFWEQQGRKQIARNADYRLSLLLSIVSCMSLFEKVEKLLFPMYPSLKEEM